jgi:deoxyribodipyrimidine photo-lyase
MNATFSPSAHTRAGALAAWEEFLPRVKVYAWKRNDVELGHRNVSRLSPALRYRLITEDELIRDTQQKYEFKTSEKWLQEICWRRYWKGWLEMRPQVWTEWRQRVAALRANLPQQVLDHAEAVAAGKSGVACMDLIARELIETGYLHNHARMWWSSFWIHAEGLPWELGADFFFRHLLDADPASNTLSWRWVAGLQTPGKTYLVRLSNLEKYAKSSLLTDLTGSERIADGAIQPAFQAATAKPALTPLIPYPTALGATHGRAGLWLHSDDLAPEIGPLADFSPVAVAASTREKSDREEFLLSEKHLTFLHDVVTDGLARAATHYHCPATLVDEDGLAEWASSQQLTEVVAFAPTVGPILDLLPHLTRELTDRGIKLTLIRRPSDAHAFALAGSGFFGFWEKLSRHLQRSQL